MEISLLRQVPLFEGLDDEQLDAIALVTITRRLEKQGYISTEGRTITIVHEEDRKSD